MSLRALLERLGLGRRPPTGPLTTAEQTTADDLEAQTALTESESAEPEHGTETE
jgi:hypothetical protein